MLRNAHETDTPLSAQTISATHYDSGETQARSCQYLINVLGKASLSMSWTDQCLLSCPMALLLAFRQHCPRESQREPFFTVSSAAVWSSTCGLSELRLLWTCQIYVPIKEQTRTNDGILCEHKSSLEIILYLQYYQWIRTWFILLLSLKQTVLKKIR